MNLKMWLYDVAREQCPTEEYLAKLCRLTLDSGYNAMGLYLEHRFAYPSAPWVAGKDALTPEIVTSIQREFPTLQIIPFINLLGHFEGFLYTEAGSHMACESFKGMSADPTHPVFLDLCEKLIDDTVQIFSSNLIHIGGDETAQLGLGGSAFRIKQFESEGTTDPKAQLYGEHFAPLAQRVIDHGRTPGVWGDMFYEHPDALAMMPTETVIFDWQYFKSPEHTSEIFREKGHKTVFCPAVHTYNATWCHLPQTEQNVKEHAEAATRLRAEGVCVTTWECGLFGNYNTILPVISACGKILNQPPTTPVKPLVNATRDEDIAVYAPLTEAPSTLKSFGEVGEDWARLMGCELQQAGGEFAFGGIRSGLKCRLLLYGNPFLFWLRHRDELVSEVGDYALQIAHQAMDFANNADQRGVTQLLIKAIDFVRYAEKAHLAYAKTAPGEAIVNLSPCRQVFEDLEKIAVANNLNSCGSLADIHRCKIAKKHVEEVILRVKHYGDGSLGYLPSFETLTHPKFVPHDQANWWLINKWANE
jgi:hypothetical protein